MDVRQRVAAVTLGLSYVVLRSLVPGATKLHERIASDAELLAWNRTLAGSLSELMRTVADTDDLMRMIHAFRTHDQAPSRTSSFHMNRLIKNISTTLTQMIRVQNASLTTAALRESLYVEQDVVPVIHTHLEGILHNRMLRDLM